MTRSPDHPAAAWLIDGDSRRELTALEQWTLVVALADAQGGAAGRAQLEEVAIPAWRIDNWVKSRRLHPWYPGVYAVGHRALGVHGRRKAAELAGGPGAALCCQTAADFRNVKPNVSGTIHLWVPNQQGRGIRGIVPHRFGDLLDHDLEVVDGIRTTTPMRTLVDMARWWSLEQIARAFDRTEENRQFDLNRLQELLARRPRRPGAPKLRHVLDMYQGPEPTLTELEKRGLQLIRKARLPKPAMQWHTSEGRVDFYWPEARLILEMDSFRWHKQRQRFEGDRSRDFEHIAQGLATPRVTWHQALQPWTVDRLRRTYYNRLVS